MRTTLAAAACAALIALSALAALRPVHAQASTRPTGLLDCVGNAPARPHDVVLTCADAIIYARRLVWTGWGEPFAAAVGEMQVNACTPNCAAGTFHSFKVVLVARGIRRCPSGVVAYSTVTYAFIGRAPPEFDPDPTVTYRCKERP
jgi:hypothetical protein